MSTDQKRINIRLAAAERRWDWEDRQRGVTYYRGTRPTRQTGKRKPLTWPMFFLELFGILALGIFMLVVLAGFLAI